MGLTPNYHLQAAAHQTVARALRRGDIARKPCEVCGSEKSNAHHDDYARPLDVMWLCPRHHRARHRDIGLGVGGRPPAALAKQRMVDAEAILRSNPSLTGSAVASAVGVGNSMGGRIVRKLRESGIVIPPPKPKSGPGQVVRIPERALDRLAEVTGMERGKDVNAQIVRAIEILEQHRGTRCA